MSLKRNVIANYLGQGWRALMALAFIPIYIRYLGMESYGLIGIYAVLQICLGLFDMGLTPALGRELARFTAGVRSSQSIQNLLRSVELIVIGIAALVAVGVWLGSGWLAVEWIRPIGLSLATASHALTLMGVVIALRFVEALYVSSLVGLQRQVVENLVSSVIATARGVGSIAVLAWFSPTIEAYFSWQCIVSMVSVACYAFSAHACLPKAPQTPHFSWAELQAVWRFSAGMLAIATLAVLTTQLDKIMLVRLLPLDGFGRYALAGAVAGALYALTIPITTAFYPRLTSLIESRDPAAVSATYHQGAQLVSVVTGSACAALILFADRVLQLWTNDASLANQVAPILRLLALGTGLNALLWMPHQVQLAYGWTSLGIRLNLVVVLVMLPALWWLVPKYGAIGAAWVWVGLNASNLIFVTLFMFRRVLLKERATWWWQDIGLPIAAATTIASLCLYVLPVGLGRAAEAVTLLSCFGAALLAASLAAPSVRQRLFEIGRVHLASRPSGAR